MHAHWSDPKSIENDLNQLWIRPIQISVTFEFMLTYLFYLHRNYHSYPSAFSWCSLDQSLASPHTTWCRVETCLVIRMQTGRQQSWSLLPLVPLTHWATLKGHYQCTVVCKHKPNKHGIYRRCVFPSLAIPHEKQHNDSSRANEFLATRPPYILKTKNLYTACRKPLPSSPWSLPRWKRSIFQSPARWAGAERRTETKPSPAISIWSTQERSNLAIDKMFVQMFPAPLASWSILWEL